MCYKFHNKIGSKMHPREVIEYVDGQAGEGKYKNPRLNRWILKRTRDQGKKQISKVLFIRSLFSLLHIITLLIILGQIAG